MRSLFLKPSILRASQRSSYCRIRVQTQQILLSVDRLQLFTTKASKEKNEDGKIAKVEIEPSADDIAKEDKKDEEKLSKFQQIKKAGIAGVISYGLWEIAFWSGSFGIVTVGYQQVTGHWPDLSDTEDMAKLSASAFVYVNFSRFAVPLRLGLALATVPWVKKNIV
eukprot:CAMPEP_0194260150 /NCGR_PEP_ID=MMETSP0158-20130606/45285_1 /TAXON_ID=33649 /ORGANISM="Thalassionema nitzschioides, Strain L26-B" /LENGTH=165 /DNA_ID=CAMNT_0039000211 /DNA_START=105 /DNA_END=599 /DNA_ORIENTATION=+